MTDLNFLPADLGRNRILDSTQAASFVGFSLPHWRRLYRAKAVPQPIAIGERKYGWRIGDLIDWIEDKASNAKAA